MAALNATGRFTLMCGDGTNDVGALKQVPRALPIVAGLRASVANGGRQTKIN